MRTPAPPRPTGFPVCPRGLPLRQGDLPRLGSERLLFRPQPIRIDRVESENGETGAAPAPSPVRGRRYVLAAAVLWSLGGVFAKSSNSTA